MWLVDHGSKGDVSNGIPIDKKVRDILMRWYVGEGSAQDHAIAVALVGLARREHKWLACDCTPHADRKPLLSPIYLTTSATYFLRRLNAAHRPKHRPDCPFYTEMAPPFVRTIGKVSGLPLETGDYFDVLRGGYPHVATQPDGSSSQASSHRANPRLRRLLSRLLTLSGCCVLDLGDTQRRRDIKSEFASLHRVAGHMRIAKGLPLERLFFTHPAAYHSNRAFAILRKAAATWPTDSEPQGFLCLFAPRVEGNRIFGADGQSIEVLGSLTRTTAGRGLTSGPWLCLVLYGNLPEIKGYAPLRAHAEPIKTGSCFLPVRSDFERDVLRRLEGAFYPDGTAFQLAVDLANTPSAGSGFRRYVLLHDGDPVLHIDIGAAPTDKHLLISHGADRVLKRLSADLEPWALRRALYPLIEIALIRPPRPNRETLIHPHKTPQTNPDHPWKGHIE